MKRLIVFSFALFSALMLFSSSFYITNTSSPALLYNEQGELTPLDTVIDTGGFLLKTFSDALFIKSPTGYIVLGASSILAIPELDYVELYLIDGTMILYSEEKGHYEVSTPISNTWLSDEGVYIFISTEGREKIYNFSKTSIFSLDGLLYKTKEIPPYTSAVVLRDENEIVDILTSDNMPEDFPLLITTEIYEEVEEEPEVVNIETVSPRVPSPPTFLEPIVRVYQVDEEEKTADAPQFVSDPIINGGDEEEVISVPTVPTILSASTLADDSEEIPDGPIFSDEPANNNAITLYTSDD